MNPLTNVRNVTKLSQRELQGNGKTSWHDDYRDSAWIFVGGLPYDLTEGDVLAIFSQWGEIVNLNLIRDKATGKSRGFGFICYENQKSTVLAVDNFNGIKLLMRTVRVDHVKDYKPPKDSDKYDDITRQLHEQGCAPETVDSLMRASVNGYDLVESEGEDEFRDDGFGSHSVLKGLSNSKSQVENRLTSSSTSTSRSADQPSSSRSHSHGNPSKEQNDERSSKISKHDRDRDASPSKASHRKKEHSRKTKKSSKKSKKKHSSKKDKKKRKHKKKVSSSESESDSSSSSSDSDSESESSSSDDSDEKHKSKKRRRRH